MQGRLIWSSIPPLTAPVVRFQVTDSTEIFRRLEQLPGNFGDRLVYATCSPLAEENEQIMQAFLTELTEFRLLHCGELLREARVGLDTGEFLRLAPHVHATDGFFAAALHRGSAC